MNKTCSNCVYLTGDWCSARLERTEPDSVCASHQGTETETRYKPSPERWKALREAAEGDDNPRVA